MSESSSRKSMRISFRPSELDLVLLQKEQDETRKGLSYIINHCIEDQLDFRIDSHERPMLPAKRKKQTKGARKFGPGEVASFHRWENMEIISLRLSPRAAISLAREAEDSRLPINCIISDCIRKSLKDQLPKHRFNDLSKSLKPQRRFFKDVSAMASGLKVPQPPSRKG